ncbi:hypothetical protein [Kribbella endophytica]
MTDLTFFRTAVLTGEVLGVDHGHSPEQVTAAFPGIEYGGNKGHSMLTLDFGLVEFSWHELPTNRYAGSHFTVQTRRLRYGPDELTAGPLADRYGPFRRDLYLKDLDLDLIQVPRQPTDFEEYLHPDSLMTVLAQATDGWVYSMSSASNPLYWAHTHRAELEQSGRTKDLGDILTALRLAAAYDVPTVTNLPTLPKADVLPPDEVVSRCLDALPTNPTWTAFDKALVDAAAGLLDQLEDQPLRDRTQRLHTARLTARS